MGHGKNICDCQCKDLKKEFHHRNLYIFKQFVNVLSTNNKNYVNVIRICFQVTLLKYKKAIKDVNKCHCLYLYYDRSDTGVVNKQHTRLNDIIVQETIHNNYSNLNWKESINNNFPNFEHVPGSKIIIREPTTNIWLILSPKS